MDDPRLRWLTHTRFACISVDNCGNESAHAGVTFGVDSSTSTVMLDQESPKPYVNVNTPTLSVRFRDLAVPSSGYHSTLQFTVDTAPVLPVTLQPGAGAQVGYVTKDITAALSEGSHTAYIKVRDYANNTADLTWNFHVDTVKPNAPGVITVASPTTDTRPNFSWADGSRCALGFRTLATQRRSTTEPVTLDLTVSLV